MTLKISSNDLSTLSFKYFIMKIVGVIILCLFISLWILSKIAIMNKELILLNNKINLQNEIMQNYIPNKEYKDFKKSIENLYKKKFSTILTTQKNIHNELANNIARIDQELVNLDYTIDDIKIIVSHNDNTVKQSEFEDFVYAVNSTDGKLRQVYENHKSESEEYIDKLYEKKIH